MHKWPWFIYGAGRLSMADAALLVLLTWRLHLLSQPFEAEGAWSSEGGPASRKLDSTIMTLR